ncbi:uncharacterized protein A4U43_C08F15080 [Asparagus officinalis]|nr:uncharacterized protein A4U43_C08F15080 [Asparagus officinalis]
MLGKSQHWAAKDRDKAASKTKKPGKCASQMRRTGLLQESSELSILCGRHRLASLLPAGKGLSPSATTSWTPSLTASCTGTADISTTRLTSRRAQHHQRVAPTLKQAVAELAGDGGGRERRDGEEARGGDEGGCRRCRTGG